MNFHGVKIMALVILVVCIAVGYALSMKAFDYLGPTKTAYVTAAIGFILLAVRYTH